MRNAFASRHAALAVALALGVFSAAAIAEDAQDQRGLVTDLNGAPVRSGFGLCVHSGFGPRPAYSQGCYADAAAAGANSAATDPAPVIVAAAPLPFYERVAFDANILFDSDKSALRPAGRDKLDKFVSEIHGLESRSVIAIGYADRMGTESANQTLSQERVDTVKAYLVSKGIASERVRTSAKGETRPTTSAGECKDANNPKNIACMQPDRHVFIEVSGNRLVK